MTTPNKIYVNTINIGDNHFSISPTDNPVDRKTQVEYLRKDALLEWAKSFTEPKIFVSTLLDKLNSM